MTKVSKAANKRAQDRISQKCRRERKSAGRHLEQALETLESISTADRDGQYSALLQTQVRLLEDNKNLQEALLGFWKRLLSISNAAATAAEDDVLGKLLHVGKGDKGVVHMELPAEDNEQGPNHSSTSTTWSASLATRKPRHRLDNGNIKAP